MQVVIVLEGGVKFEKDFMGDVQFQKGFYSVIIKAKDMIGMILWKTFTPVSLTCKVKSEHTWKKWQSGSMMC